MFSDDDKRAEQLIEEAMTSADPWTVAAVRTFRSALAENRGDDVARSRADAETSLAEFREMGERWGMGNCLQLLAPMNTLAGNLAQAASDYREALDLFSSLGAMEDESFIRMRLADVLIRQGDISGARREIELAARQSERKPTGPSRLGADRESLFGAAMMADIARQTGDLDRARALLDDARQRLQLMPEPHPAQAHLSSIVYVLAAKIDLTDGELGLATTNLEHAYRYAVGTRDMPIVANVGVGLAMLAAARGRYPDCATILGASAQVRGADDPTALDIVALDALLSQNLDAPTLAGAQAAGRMLAREDAIARLDPARLAS
jgi:tetratricopeptide (TPR) repeat protein